MIGNCQLGAVTSGNISILREHQYAVAFGSENGTRADIIGNEDVTALRFELVLG